MNRFILTFLFFIAGLAAFSADRSSAAPIWSWSCDEHMLNIRLTLPNGYYSYPEETFPELSPVSLPQKKPVSKKRKDPLLDAEINVFSGPGTYLWSYPLKDLRFPLKIMVRWQMCREGKGNSYGTCLMPGSDELAGFSSQEEMIKKHAGTLLISPEPDATAEGEEEADSGKPLMLASFRTLRTAVGYLSPNDFSSFLKGTSPSAFSFAGKGILASLLLALVGGLALNLTPCVLPLIPVNLAIIGAGETSANPHRVRILRGSLYGAGIACTYGILGVIAVLTGSAFSSLDSSWIFNLCAALIFLVLGCAMFGLFRFDLSSFSSHLRVTSSAKLGGVFLMGVLSAILAGACVAPVIAAALIQASGMAAAGNYAGLFLPSLVGLGMALPWPFAAAGISLFPKPGMWMVYVRRTLAVLILLLALYYGWTSVSLFTAQLELEQNPDVPATSQSACQQINDALEKSAETGKPVLLDFGASWCKSCRMMDIRTLRDPEIRKELQNVIVLKLNMDRPTEPAAAELLKTFQVTGFPTFLLVEPESKP